MWLRPLTHPRGVATPFTFLIFPLRSTVCMSFTSAPMSMEERLFISRVRLPIAGRIGYGVERGRRTTDLVLSLEPKLLVFFLSTFTLIFANSKLTVNTKMPQ